MRLSSALLLCLSSLVPNVWGATHVYTAMLDGATAGNGSPGTGMSTVTIDDVANTIHVQVSFSGLTGTSTLCHIHGPTASQNTGTAGPATTTPSFVGFPAGVHAGSFDNVLSLMDAGTFSAPLLSMTSNDVGAAATILLNAIADKRAYVNIHTSEFGGGEIAGFLEPVAKGSGDPQFVGFQGQSFQVHGIPDTIFGIISAPDFQMNSNFAYIGTGGKCDYDNTQCWSHPGTYMDRIGVLLRDPTSGNETRVALTAGSHAAGLHLKIDGQTIRHDPMGNNTHEYGPNLVRFHGYDEVTITTDILQITLTNSDHFMNLATALLRADWLRLGRRLPVSAKNDGSWPHLHGLLGQTWRATSYEQGRLFEGSIDDYVLETQDLHSIDFTFSQYKQ